MAELEFPSKGAPKVGDLAKVSIHFEGANDMIVEGFVVNRLIASKEVIQFSLFCGGDKDHIGIMRTIDECRSWQCKWLNAVHRVTGLEWRSVVSITV